MRMPPNEIDRDAPFTPGEAVLGLIGVFAPAIALLLVACCCTAGCVYRGAKVTEGTDLAIGLNVPVTEGTVQLQVLNYLSGFRLGVDRNAILECTYSVTESNSYFGVVNTRVTKSMLATVTPCETSAGTNAPAAPAASDISTKTNDCVLIAQPGGVDSDTAE